MYVLQDSWNQALLFSQQQKGGEGGSWMMKPWWSTTLALFLLAFTCSSSTVERCLHQASMLVFFSLSTPVLRLWMMRAAHTSPSINHTSKTPRIQLFLTLQLTGTHWLLCHETQSQFGMTHKILLQQASDSCPQFSLRSKEEQSRWMPCSSSSSCMFLHTVTVNARSVWWVHMGWWVCMNLQGHSAQTMHDPYRRGTWPLGFSWMCITGGCFVVSCLCCQDCLENSIERYYSWMCICTEGSCFLLLLFVKIPWGNGLGAPSEMCIIVPRLVFLLWMCNFIATRVVCLLLACLCWLSRALGEVDRLSYFWMCIATRRYESSLCVEILLEKWIELLLPDLHCNMGFCFSLVSCQDPLEKGIDWATLERALQPRLFLACVVENPFEKLMDWKDA